jgi:hypothetical protein
MMYYNTRFLWPPKKNEVVDQNLQEMREHLDELKESQKASKPRDLDDDDYHEFMLRMYQKFSRVIEAEGEWNELLQARAQETLAQQQAEIEEVLAQEEAEAKEKLREDAIEAAGRMFGHNASQTHQPETHPDDEHDNSELYHTAMEDVDNSIATGWTDGVHQRAKVCVLQQLIVPSLNIRLPTTTELYFVFLR